MSTNPPYLLKPWPRMPIEHEMRSIRRFIRQFEDCPEEVRVMPFKSDFIRPSLVIAVAPGAPQSLGRHFKTLNRSGNLTWYGERNDQLGWREAVDASDWMTAALGWGDISVGGMGVIPIFDWSGDLPSPTPHFIEIDTDSVSGTPERDTFNYWMVNMDFRYSVRLGTAAAGLDPVITPPDPVEVTAIEGQYIYDVHHVPE